MALTQPFINTMSAFSVTTGTTTYFSVKDGNAITSYRFYLYDNNGTTTPIYTSSQIAVSGDVADVTIRNFDIDLTTAGVLAVLTNNNSYKISVRTYNLTETSSESNQTLFDCYAQPSIKIQQLTIVEEVSTYVDLENDDTVNSSTVSVQLVFNPNDLNSIAQPNNAQIILYGVNDDSTEDLLFTSGSLYNFTHNTLTDEYTYQTEVSGFSKNVDSNGDLLPSDERQYASFKIVTTASTIENFEISQTITGIDCYYSVLSNSPYLIINNLCDDGVIEINCSLTSFEGTSNPTPPTYITDEEVDLTATDSWVQWQNYFTLSQPYTLSLWGRDFNVGIIAQMTSTVYAGKYVRLEYNDDGTNTYISLYCGQNDYLGNAMFPYYIESQKILSSTITSSTVLFIGLQQSDSLFNLDFEIIP
jgi:hypothetical protein